MLFRSRRYLIVFQVSQNNQFHLFATDRYASTRFPAKPLAILGGKTVIQRVYEQVAGVLDDVYVAMDDERIEAAVKAFGGKVVMTSVDHKSGTDRCYEACTKIGGDFDVAQLFLYSSDFRSEERRVGKECRL